MTENSKKKGLAAAAGIAGLVGVVLLKSKGALIVVLKFFPLIFTKLGLILKGGLSLFLSLGVYWAMFGWQWAITIIVLLYIHEMGHFLYMKVKGLEPNAPVFVPFVGAYVAMNKLPDDVATHAWVAYWGPLVGGLASLLMFYFGLKTSNMALVAAAHTGFLLNLLQLVPAKPLDGGFIAEGIHRWLLVPGTILLLVAGMALHSFLFSIIGLISGIQLFLRWRSGFAPTSQKQATTLQRLAITAAYLALVGCLGYFMLSTELHLADVLHK